LEALYISADFDFEKNCTLHDVERPSKAINDANIGHHANYIHFTKFTENSPEVQELCQKADIIIVERNLFNDVLVMMQYWKVRNKTIMCVFDDGYHVITRKNPTYAFWNLGEITVKDAEGKESKAKMLRHPLEQMKWGLQMSVGLQTVSPAIADYWRPVTDTYIIHNNIFIKDYANAEPLYKHPNEIWIGWCGSLSHVDGFTSSGLLRAFRKITRLYPQVRILIGGDRKIYDMVDVSSQHKAFSPFVPDAQYPGLIKSFDIYTIPLSGEYDKCRSQIKAVESLACKVPTIATDYPNYAHMRDKMFVTENGWENWVNAISNAIDNLPQYREHASDVGFKYAESQDYSLHVQERIDLYQHMIEKGYNREQEVCKCAEQKVNEE
jgi:glycosyltransferase involved in cell wall biosynthesis